MASRGEELNTRLTATDDASAIVDRVADSLDELDGKDATVDLDADAALAAASELDNRLDRLTDEERVAVLRVQAKQAERELAKISRDLANAANLEDEEIDIRIEAKGNAEARLDRIQSEIRAIDGSTPDIRPEVDTSGIDTLAQKIDDLQLPVGNLGSSLSSLGSSRTAGAGALVALLGAAANEAANYAVEVDNISQLTGASVEETSRLVSVFARAGVETNDIQDIILQVNGVLADNNELAAQLGINLNDGRSGVLRFIDTVDALGTQFEDATQRGVVGSQLFGEEGVRQVNAVISTVGDLGDAYDEVNDRNILSQEDIERAREFKQSTAELNEEMRSLSRTLGFAATEAIAFGASGVSTVFDNLASRSEAFGQGLRGLFTDDLPEGIKQLEEFGLAGEESARRFDRALIANAESAAEVRQIAAEYGQELEAQNIIVAEWARTQGLIPGAAADAANALSEIPDAAELGAARFTAAQDLIQQSIGQSQFRLENYGVAGLEAFQNAQRGVDRFADRFAQLDESQALFNIRDALGAVRTAQEDVNEARRDGAGDVLDFLAREQQARNNLERQVLDYIEYLGDVPDQVVTDLTTAIQEGDTVRVRRQLEDLTREREVDVDLRIDTRDADRAIDQIEDRLSGIGNILQEQDAVFGLADGFERILDAQEAIKDADNSRDRDRAVTDEAKARNDLAQDVLRYAELVEDIPDETVAEIITAIQNDSLSTVEQRLEELTKDRTVNVSFAVDRGADALTVGGSNGVDLVELRPERAATAGASVVVNQTVYQLNPDPQTIDQAARDAAFVQGPRGQRPI